MIFEEEDWLDDSKGVVLNGALFESAGAAKNLTICTEQRHNKKNRKRKKKQCQLVEEKAVKTETLETTHQSENASQKGSSVNMSNRKDALSKSEDSKGSSGSHSKHFSIRVISEQAKSEARDITQKRDTKSHKRGWKKNNLAKMLEEACPTSDKDKTANSSSGKRRKLKSNDNSQTTSLIQSVSTQSSRSSALTFSVTSKLQSAQFRFINEQLYTRDSKEAKKLFANDPRSFQVYHSGFNQQVAKWPVNPLDLIINFIRKRPTSWVIGDFGCGDARLAKSVKNKVHSFDLVAVNERVTAADISNVPLQSHTLDVAVFCLSLMGTNYLDFLIEANRTLKMKGLLLISEVASRFKSVPNFITLMKKLGFELKRQDRKNSHFFLFDFIKTKLPLPEVMDKMGVLKPCVYKKR